MLYQNTKGLPKVDKYGIRSKTESVILACLRLAIKAALMQKLEKLPVVKELKIEIETLKQFIRLELELSTLKEKNYGVFQEKLQEISKMTSGWIEYLQQKELNQ
ncbi:MAG: hypothetical protein UT32_C0010G0037 [Parcubacteria group bacterium GW2011_GWC2_39_14]|nr:MAG: hypothetical protein UT32_C0010G0037 [Parcubacteria group bacterium GW2011_GWC2_39_14]KKR55136.1 MAG: hypothetical protein UT91_C0004G0035 [Parcubacteria group bacterium GW2011_GWA2_40_23]